MMLSRSSRWKMLSTKLINTSPEIIPRITVTKTTANKNDKFSGSSRDGGYVNDSSSITTTATTTITNNSKTMIQSKLPAIKTRLHVRSRHHHLPHTRNNNACCNKFLLGGSHYPGKDKKRNYRDFWGCSSMVGRVILIVVSLYLLITFGFRPLIVRFRSETTAVNDFANTTVITTTITPAAAGGDYDDGNDGDGTDNDIQIQNEGTSSITDDEQQLIVSDEAKEENQTNTIIRTLHNTDQHAMNCNCPGNLHSDSMTTTLVLQTTVDRLPFLHETCDRWMTNPIIVVVYITPGKNDDADELDDEQYWNDNQQTFRDICISAIFIPYVGESKTEKKMGYPINMLRNLGLDQVKTSHVLVMDVDFIPSEGLDSIIDEAILTRKKQQLLQHGNGVHSVAQKDAIVIPAFERTLGKPCMTMEDCLENLEILENIDDALDEEKFMIAHHYIPRTMDDLRDCHASSKTTTTTTTITSANNRGCAVFQSDVNWEGHSSTRAEEWLLTKKTLDTSALMRQVPCFDSKRYEPYVVIPWCALSSFSSLRQSTEQQPQQPISPYYDERFYGYGKNKIQNIAHLRERGYSFSVLPPDGFIIHRPHPVSATKDIWNKSGSYNLHKKMDKLYPKYLKELQQRYSDSSITTTTIARTPICKKRQRVGGKVLI